MLLTSNILSDKLDVNVRFFIYQLDINKDIEFHKKTIDEIRYFYKTKNLYVNIIVFLDGIQLKTQSLNTLYVKSGEKIKAFGNINNIDKYSFVLDPNHILSLRPGMYLTSKSGIKLEVENVCLDYAEFVNIYDGIINIKDIFYTKEVELFSCTDIDQIKINMLSKLDINYICAPISNVKDLKNIQENVNQACFIYYILHYNELDQILNLSNAALININALHTLYRNSVFQECIRIREKHINKPVLIEFKESNYICNPYRYDGFINTDIDDILDIDYAIITSKNWLVQLVIQKQVRYIIADNFNNDLQELAVARVPNLLIFISSKDNKNKPIRGIRGVVLVDSDKDDIFISIQQMILDNISYIIIKDNTYTLFEKHENKF